MLLGEQIYLEELQKKYPLYKIFFWFSECGIGESLKSGNIKTAIKPLKIHSAREYGIIYTIPIYPILIFPICILAFLYYLVSFTWACFGWCRTTNILIRAITKEELEETGGKLLSSGAKLVVEIIKILVGPIVGPIILVAGCCTISPFDPDVEVVDI